jgi:hypothetical protein
MTTWITYRDPRDGRRRLKVHGEVTHESEHFVTLERTALGIATFRDPNPPDRVVVACIPKRYIITREEW